MLRRRTVGTIIAGFVAALAAGCRESPRTATRAPAAAPADALRVLTYNIHHGEGMDGVLDLERIARVIEAGAPDLVALQEVDNGAARTGGVDQAAELGRLTGMHHAFAPFMDFEGGQYGLAILSEHPIQVTRVIALPPGKHEPRVALATEVMIPGHASVTLACLHLDWLENDTERYAQAQALVAALEDDHGVIVAGDFNDTPLSRTLSLLAETYADAAKPAGARATFPSRKPREEIDLIMYRPSYAFVGSAVVLEDRTASDHRPVLATLEWVHGE